MARKQSETLIRFDSREWKGKEIFKYFAKSDKNQRTIGRIIDLFVAISFRFDTIAGLEEGEKKKNGAYYSREQKFPSEVEFRVEKVLIVLWKSASTRIAPLRNAILFGSNELWGKKNAFRDRFLNRYKLFIYKFTQSILGKSGFIERR